ncbi:MAG: alpha/beta fold hydrolase [Chthoniobacterales bacterium]
MHRTLLVSLGCALLLSTTSAKSPGSSPHFAQLDDMRVHYTDYGKGEIALVLVHGWNCDESVWRYQAHKLARQMHVITIDLPGHGQSDKPQIAYTMDLHARAIDAVLQDAQVKAAVLVGHSNGTPAVWQFYRRYREKVRGLVIVDGALKPFGDQAFMERFIAPLRGRDYEDTALRLAAGMTAPMKDASEREQVRAMMLSGPEHVAVSEMEGLTDPALWQEEKIEVPVLMILAKQPAWTTEYEQFVKSLIPNLDYEIWTGVSHFIMLDAPNEFNHAISRFVKKNELMKSWRSPAVLRGSG